jgi:TPR repeat protein
MRYFHSYLTVLIVFSFPCYKAIAADTNQIPRNSEATPSKSVTKEKISTPRDQFLLGVAYYFGKGVDQSYEKAGEWFLKASEGGYQKAQVNLGIMYLEGKGCEKSPQKASDFFAQAAKGVDPEVAAQAKYFEATILCDGNGTNQDLQKGLDLMTAAAKEGNPKALYRLGMDALTGKNGQPADQKRAIDLLSQAAEKGSALACRRLGAFYTRGIGVEKNADTASKWFEKGARTGDGSCILQMANELNTTNPVQTAAWLKLANDYNLTGADGPERLRQLNQKLTPDQIKDAEMLNSKLLLVVPKQ